MPQSLLPASTPNRTYVQFFDTENGAFRASIIDSWAPPAANGISTTSGGNSSAGMSQKFQLQNDAFVAYIVIDVSTGTTGVRPTDTATAMVGTAEGDSSLGSVICDLSDTIESARKDIYIPVNATLTGGVVYYISFVRDGNPDYSSFWTISGQISGSLGSRRHPLTPLRFYNAGTDTWGNGSAGTSMHYWILGSLVEPWESINETMAAPDDSTYIKTTQVPIIAGDDIAMHLQPGSDPLVSTSHIVKFRMAGLAGTTSFLSWSLVQGYQTITGSLNGTTILSGTGSFVGSTLSPTVVTTTLSTAQADSITDYADLSLRIQML